MQGNTCWTLFGSLRQFSLKRQMIFCFSICHANFILPCLIVTTSYTKAIKSLFFLEEDLKPNRNYMSKLAAIDYKCKNSSEFRILSIMLRKFSSCMGLACFSFVTILLHFSLFSYKLNKIQNPHVCSICLKVLIPE